MKIDEWDRVKQAFRDHFRGTEVEGNRLRFSSGRSTYLELDQSGEIEASMPLHSFSSDEVEEIEFEEDRVVVSTPNGEYVYRK